MTNFYLSKETIEESYNTLANTDFNYGNEFFHLLVLKYAGISQHNFINLSDDSVKEKILEATKRLSWLFSNEQNFRNKNARYNFINPFRMKSWEKSSPSEPIIKWSPARLINNVTGGGKQWKLILADDEADANTIKLKHNYLDYFKDMTVKYPLDAISIWLFRFFKFSSEFALSALNSQFYTDFKITDEEKTHFFSNRNNVNLIYSDTPTDPQYVRSLIGNPDDTNWLAESENVDVAMGIDLGASFTSFDTSDKTNSGKVQDAAYYKKLLEKAQQAILMGPPGTSKSYVTNNLSSVFDHTKRIQFHPQYSYQDFIGGKILESGNLVDKKGEFILFLEEALANTSKSYLLIIEEINRANVSQVFGELIQLLDRGEKISLTFNSVTNTYELPKNLKIIGTMNTTDRTVGRIDYAIKRRFYQIYFGVDYSVLVDKVSIVGNAFSIADVLRKINSKLLSSLNNKEMVIGHAIFLKDFVRDASIDKYVWTVNDFSDVFNYVVLPIVEDYCNGNSDLTTMILGENLLAQLNGEEFIQAIREYLTK